MSKQFIEFVKLISTDPQALVTYRANPDAVLDAAHLTEVEKKAVKSGSIAAVRKIAGSQLITAFEGVAGDFEDVTGAFEDGPDSLASGAGDVTAAFEDVPDPK